MHARLDYPRDVIIAPSRPATGNQAAPRPFRSGPQREQAGPLGEAIPSIGIRPHSPAFTRLHPRAGPLRASFLDTLPFSVCPPCTLLLATWNSLPSPPAARVFRLVLCPAQAARELALYLSDPRCTLAKLVLSKADVDDFEVGRNKSSGRVILQTIL